MKEHTFDAMTRRAVKQVSRRTSLAALSAAGLAALAAPLSADAKKKKNNNKKDKKKAQQRAEQECEEQVAQCQSILGSVSGIPASKLTCCNFLGACDFPSFSLCFFGV